MLDRTFTTPNIQLVVQVSFGITMDVNRVETMSSKSGSNGGGKTSSHSIERYLKDQNMVLI